MALGHHLRAQQHLHQSVAKSLERLRVAAGLAHGVAIHAADHRPGEMALEFLVHLLGAQALVAHGGLAAGGAFIVGRLVEAAMVAHEDVAFAVEGERQVAEFTGGGVAAGRANDKRGVTPAVEEQDGLSANAIHGNKSQGQRERALAEFRNGRAPILVINGDVITGTDVDQRLALIITANGGKVSAEEKERLRVQVLRNLIDETLQIQEAAANDIKIDPAEVSSIAGTLAVNDLFVPAERTCSDQLPCRRWPLTIWVWPISMKA